MVISWTRLLGSPRVTVPRHDDALLMLIEESLRGRVTLSAERGSHRRDGTTPHLVFLVRSLCSKLGDSSRAPRYIETVSQAGYRLVAA